MIFRECKILDKILRGHVETLETLRDLVPVIVAEAMIGRRLFRAILNTAMIRCRAPVELYAPWRSTGPRRSSQSENWSLWLVAAAAIVLGSTGTYIWHAREARTQPKEVEVAFDGKNIPPDQVAELDFSNTVSQRASVEPIVNSHARELIIHLPCDSPAGNYALELREVSTGKPEIAASKTNVSQDAKGTLVLKAVVDFSKVPGGPHVVAWGLVNSTTWNEGSVEVRWVQ